MNGVYLLHFSKAYKHAKHYLGYADDIDKRIAEHRTGQGARLTQVARAHGIDLLLARIWAHATRDDERQIKGTRTDGGRHHRGGLGRVCPICREAHNQQKRLERERAKAARVGVIYAS